MSSNKSADYPCISLTAGPSGLLQMLQKTHSQQGLQMKKYNRQSSGQKMIAQNEEELSIHAGFGGGEVGAGTLQELALNIYPVTSTESSGLLLGGKMICNSSPSQACSQIFSRSQKQTEWGFFQMQ